MKSTPSRSPQTPYNGVFSPGSRPGNSCPIWTVVTLAVGLATCLVLLGWQACYISLQSARAADPTRAATKHMQLVSLDSLTSFINRSSDALRQQQVATCKNLLQSVLSGMHLAKPDSDSKLMQLLRELDGLVATVGVMEGHVGQVRLKQQLYMDLASIPCVKTICEIGFNAGHSAVTWLSARDDTMLISFDLGAHGYGPVGVNFVKTQFPGRHIMMYGNSTATVTSARKLLGHKCDITVVDGGHDYATALADTLNMRDLANKDFHFLIVDDVQCTPDFCVGVQKALDHVVSQNLVQVHYNLSLDQQGNKVDTFGARGLSVGEYLWTE